MSSLSSPSFFRPAPAARTAARATPRHGPLRALALAWAAAALLAACGGGGGSAPAGNGPPAEREGALAASRPGELTAYVRGKLRDRMAAQAAIAGAEDGAAIPSWYEVGLVTTDGTVVRSGTVVQENGVDEDDLIKTDGRTIYTLESLPQSASGSPFARLHLHRRQADGSLQEASPLVLLAERDQVNGTYGMLLAEQAQRIAVLASAGGALSYPDCPDVRLCTLPFAPQRGTSQVVVHVADVADPDRAALRERLAIDGDLVGARLVGNMLYLATVYTPRFPVEVLPASAGDAAREAALAALTPADVLPRLRVGEAAAQPLLAETDCYLQPKNASTALQVTSITAFDLASPTLARSSRCFIGGTEALYMAPGSIYLATTRYPVTFENGTLRFDDAVHTDLHKFAVAGAAITYRASGTVTGHLGWDREKAPLRLSEHQGDLRVLSFTGQRGWFGLPEADQGGRAPSPATLTILRERASDASLQPVATLPNAQRPAPLGGDGEQVYGVRFLGERAYVVTFRRTDPLYVLDLANPADPRIAGELKIPGVSDYLFPVGDGLLLGLGRDADAQGRLGGLKASLFDVANPAAPRELATQVWGGRGSAMTLEASRHGIAFGGSAAQVRVALPVGLVDDRLGTQQSGLQRLEIDTTRRSMTARPLLAGSRPGWSDLATQRSVSIGEQLYHLSDGRVQTWNWSQ